jgi:hypothetical protein
MVADARECRQRASRCAELAMTARTMQLKAAFLELSKNWERLAIDLENSLGRRDEMEALRSDVRDSQKLNGFLIYWVQKIALPGLIH